VNLSVDLCILYTLARSLFVSKKTFSRVVKPVVRTNHPRRSLRKYVRPHAHQATELNCEGSFQEHLGVFNQSPQ